jgi:predicted transcriptional regulator
MRLTAYLEAIGESPRAFADRNGIQRTTIYRICNGGSCSATTALAIVRATKRKRARGGGYVRLEDLARPNAAA